MMVPSVVITGAFGVVDQCDHFGSAVLANGRVRELRCRSCADGRKLPLRERDRKNGDGRVEDKGQKSLGGDTLEA